MGDEKERRVYYLNEGENGTKDQVSWRRRFKKKTGKCQRSLRARFVNGGGGNSQRETENVGATPKRRRPDGSETSGGMEARLVPLSSPEGETPDGTCENYIRVYKGAKVKLRLSRPSGRT